MVDFTINEEGGISNVSISMTSGKPEVEKILVELVNKMPKRNKSSAKIPA